MRQFPGILQAIRRFLILEGTPELATAVHTLLPPPIPTILIVPAVDSAEEAAEIQTACYDPPTRLCAPHAALRLAVHLATLCEVTDVGLVEEFYPSLPSRPATTGLSAGVVVPPEGSGQGMPLPAASVPGPRWLERLAAGVLTHRGLGCLASSPAQQPNGTGAGGDKPSGSGGWGWTPEGMARAVRALARSVAMREQGLDMGPLQMVFRAGGSPALLGCLLAPPAPDEEGSGEAGEAEAKGVEAAAASLAAGVPPLPPPDRPVLPGKTKGSKRKRAPDPEPDPEPGQEGGAAVPAVVVAAAAASGCSWCGKVEGQGEGGGLLRCGRCKEARYCSRACQCRHWKDGGHRKQCRPVPPAGEGAASA